MVSLKRKNRQEELPVQPISLELIPISKIAVPDSQEKDISPERQETLSKSLVDQGSNLIPLLVRLMDNYNSEQQYEIVRGADWCQVAKETEIKELWAWIYEITDEQAETAKAEMDKLTQSALPEKANFDDLLQEIKLSFDQKVDSLAKKIDQSIKKNEDVLKKQVKSLQGQTSDLDQIEQLKSLITNLENSVNNKVETLTRKIANSTTKKTTSSFLSGVNVELLSKQLDDLDKQIEKKLEGMVKTINQYVSQSIQDIEDDLKTQVSAVRRQLQAIPELDTQVEVEAKTQTPTKTTTKKPSSTASRSKATTTKTTTRKTKAAAAPAEPEVPGDDYDTKSLRQLKKIAQERKLRGYARMKRPEILKALREADAAS